MYELRGTMFSNGTPAMRTCAALLTAITLTSPLQSCLYNPLGRGIDIGHADLEQLL